MLYGILILFADFSAPGVRGMSMHLSQIKILICFLVVLYRWLETKQTKTIGGCVEETISYTPLSIKIYVSEVGCLVSSHNG